LPSFPPIRVFLDANVLFSAAYSDENRMLAFWRYESVFPETCPYAINEARSHIVRPGHADRLSRLLQRTTIVSDADKRIVPQSILLVEKDKPILAAAIQAGVDYLITGDKNHFGPLMDSPICGVIIVMPKPFIDTFAERLSM